MASIQGSQKGWMKGMSEGLQSKLQVEEGPFPTSKQINHGII